MHLAQWVISERRQKSSDLLSSDFCFLPWASWWKLWWFCDFGAFLLGPNLRVSAAFAGDVKCFPPVSWEGNLNLLEIGAVTKTSMQFPALWKTLGKAWFLHSDTQFWWQQAVNWLGHLAKPLPCSLHVLIAHLSNGNNSSALTHKPAVRMGILTAVKPPNIGPVGSSDHHRSLTI